MAAPDSSISGGLWPWLLVLAVVLAVGGFLLARSRREPEIQEHPQATPMEPPAPTVATIDELRAQAAESLVEADNAITTSSTELGIALAHADDESVWAPFTQALAQSREELAEALVLRDRGPAGDDEPDQRTWLEAIITLARGADARLDDLVPRFDALRDLEHHIEEVLPGLDQQMTALEDPLSRARATAADLANRYPDVAVATVLGNLDHAVERIRVAGAWVAAGARDLTAGERRTAVARARAVEEALSQAAAILDGVQHAPEDLAHAERAVTTLLAATEGGVAEAERLGMPEGLSTTHPYAQDTIKWARGEADTGSYDPIATRRALEDTDTALEVGLAPRRAAQEARRRALTLLESVPANAQSSLRVAGCFIATRRGAVGAEARVCLARAAGLFASGTAITQTDPSTALADLQEADALADQALRLAQQDEASYLNAQRMGGHDAALTTLVASGILVARPPAVAGSGSTTGEAGSDQQVWAAASFGGAATRSRWVLSELP